MGCLVEISQKGGAPVATLRAGDWGLGTKLLEYENKSVHGLVENPAV